MIMPVRRRHPRAPRRAWAHRSGPSASISLAAIALLRDESGFDGLVVTDDLGAMAAITDRVAWPASYIKRLRLEWIWHCGSRRTGSAMYSTALEQAVTGGSRPESRVNEAVAHVLGAEAVDLCSVS